MILRTGRPIGNRQRRDVRVDAPTLQSSHAERCRAAWLAGRHNFDATRGETLAGGACLEDRLLHGPQSLCPVTMARQRRQPPPLGGRKTPGERLAPALPGADQIHAHAGVRRHGRQHAPAGVCDRKSPSEFLAAHRHARSHAQAIRGRSRFDVNVRRRLDVIAAVAQTGQQQLFGQDASGQPGRLPLARAHGCPDPMFGRR